MAEHGFTISEVSVGGSQVRLAMIGELGEHVDEAALRTPLVEHLDNDGVREIILDISALRMLSLEAIAALIFLSGEVAAHGKVLRMVGATGQPHQKLRTTGMLIYLRDPPPLPDRNEDV